jgi:hypothetical protein
MRFISKFFEIEPAVLELKHADVGTDMTVPVWVLFLDGQQNTNSPGDDGFHPAGPH